MSKTVFKQKQKLTGLFPVPQNYVSQFVGRGHNPVTKHIYNCPYPLASWSHS